MTTWLESISANGIDCLTGTTGSDTQSLCIALCVPNSLILLWTIEHTMNTCQIQLHLGDCAIPFKTLQFACHHILDSERYWPGLKNLGCACSFTPRWTGGALAVPNSSRTLLQIAPVTPPTPNFPLTGKRWRPLQLDVGEPVLPKQHRSTARHDYQGQVMLLLPVCM